MTRPTAWRGNVSCDGVTIVQGVEGWAIVPADEAGEVLVLCPCCGRRMSSPEAARRIADRAYPLNAEAVS